MVLAMKWEALRNELKDLGLKGEDFKESFIKGSGPGGQKVNKASSRVRLLHIPTGIVVEENGDRSIDVNRFHALKKFLEKYRVTVLGEKGAGEARAAKVRKQKKRRRRRGKCDDTT